MPYYAGELLLPRTIAANDDKYHNTHNVRWQANIQENLFAMTADYSLCVLYCYKVQSIKGSINGKCMVASIFKKFNTYIAGTFHFTTL